MISDIYTIGHSTHSMDTFVQLLKSHLITAICDVRSKPYSRFNPQFNRERLKEELRQQNIAYVFLGLELGGRTTEPDCILDGRVQYKCLAKTEKFRKGIDRIERGMRDYRIALMCAEKDPINCHRMLLIGKYLKNRNIQIKHILEDGKIEKNSDTENRLMDALNIPPRDFFLSHEELIERAYELQSQKIAYIVGHRNEINREKDSFYE
jgi:uncharacterized protein (DUF488 family)